MSVPQAPWGRGSPKKPLPGASAGGCGKREMPVFGLGSPAGEGYWRRCSVTSVGRCQLRVPLQKHCNWHNRASGSCQLLTTGEHGMNNFWCGSFSLPLHAISSSGLV